MPDDLPTITEPPRPPLWQRVLGNYVPAGFLAWAIYGMARPAFDSTASFDPIFWAVAGGCLLTLWGRYHTRDIDVEDADMEESLRERWHFSDLPRRLRRENKK
jgi:hypothetical protein